MPIVVQTAPAVEPISLAEAKTHLRVDIPDDDALIQGFIRAARLNLERTYRRAFLTQTLMLSLDYFGQPDFTPTWMYGWPPTMLTYGPTGWMVPTASTIELRAPVQSVTSVTYVDPSGTTQTLAPANYTLDIASEPGRLMPAQGKIWPVTAPVPNAVQVTFVAGYTSPGLVPDDMKSAIKLLLGVWYQNREQVTIATRLVAVELPYGVQALMANYAYYLVR